MKIWDQLNLKIYKLLTENTNFLRYRVRGFASGVL